MALGSLLPKDYLVGFLGTVCKGFWCLGGFRVFVKEEGREGFLGISSRVRVAW